MADPALEETVEISNGIVSCRVPVSYPLEFRKEVLDRLTAHRDTLKVERGQIQRDIEEAEAIRKGLKPDPFAQYRTTKIMTIGEAQVRWYEKISSSYNPPENYLDELELMRHRTKERKERSDEYKSLGHGLFRRLFDWVLPKFRKVEI